MTIKPLDVSSNIRSGLIYLITLQVPIVTNINFLLTISSNCQEMQLRELTNDHQRENTLIPSQLAPVVQTSDSAIHWINHYPADIVIDFRNTYPLDSDLSGG